MTHIMVDLETWGLTPGSDIRSIGAVEFDPVTGRLGQEFYVNVVNPPMGGGDMQPRYPLTRDPSTVEWWSQQSPEAQARLTTGILDLKLGLARFHDWWQWVESETCEDATFWANGPHFDEAILTACYRATGLPVPWSYRAPRDCRTIYEAAGGVDIPFEGVQHDALADAKHQARCVIEAYRKLRQWPEYDTDIPDALDAYSKECSTTIGRFGITERMSGTFRWHEAWDRVRTAIAARRTAA